MSPSGRIFKIINARVSVPTWLMLFSSTAIALLADLVAFTRGDKAFDSMPYVSMEAWALVLTIGALGIIVGMSTKKVWALRAGAMVSFLGWLWGSLVFALNGQSITVVVVTLPWLAFYVYLYIASYFRTTIGL